MRELSLTEPVTLFWRKDIEELKFHPESRYFAQASEAIVWAFETLSSNQRWSALLRFEKDHEEARLTELESTYQSLRAK